MKKYLLTSLAMLSIALAFGQNYVSGAIGLYGPSWNAATTIPTGGQALVSTAGNWWFGGIVSKRTGTGSFTFDGTGTYSNALLTSYTDGVVNRTGSNVDFTFPVGDAGATVGGVYHPLMVSAASATLTTSVIYNASSTTPNPTLLGTGVGKVDPIANWGFTSAAATATVTLTTRDETGIFGAAGIYVAGFNTSTNVWEKIGVATAIVVGGNTLVSNAGITLSDYSAFTAAGDAAGLLVSPKVFLQGALTASTMSTTLSALAAFPTAQPYNYAPFNYAGTETLASIPATMTDWVLVELKSATTPFGVIATKAAVLLSNGNVTDVDGVSPVFFANQSAGNYIIGIRHRNHLPVRLSTGIALNTSTTTTCDFTGGVNLYNDPAVPSNLPEANTSGSIYAMWAGDVNANGKSRYSGPLNDPAYILATYLSGNNLTFLTGVYSPGDINMNGVVRYSGPSNDPAFLLSTVLGSNNLTIISQHY